LASFYADENFRYPVVEALRRLGHDVLTCQAAGRAGSGIEDDVVLADALALDRIVLTPNRKHFIRLHNGGQPHKGIVVCTFDRDAEALAQRIDRTVSAEPPGGRWLVRVNRPNPGGSPRQDGGAPQDPHE
jgi:hypothetical protein